MTTFRIELLEKKHDRSVFDCGVPILNQYFTKQVSQDVRRNVTACFLAIEKETDIIAGYYTLSAGSVDLSDLPEKTKKKLPRYPTVPITLIGRLAVDLNFQGQQLGAALLFDAIERSMNTEMGVWAVVVDAKDENAINFYAKYGFNSIASNANRMFLPLSEGYKLLTDSKELT